MRAAFAVPATVSGLLLMAGCSLVLQGARTEGQFRKALPSQPYIADTARSETILSGAKQIRICSRRADVRRLMGEPDFGVLTHDSSGNHTAARWTYLISEEPRAKRAVEVSLNKAGDVFSIIPLGLPDIHFSTVNDGPGCESR